MRFCRRHFRPLSCMIIYGIIALQCRMSHGQWREPKLRQRRSKTRCQSNFPVLNFSFAAKQGISYQIYGIISHCDLWVWHAYGGTEGPRGLNAKRRGGAWRRDEKKGRRKSACALPQPLSSLFHSVAERKMTLQNDRKLLQRESTIDEFRGRPFEADIEGQGWTCKQGTLFVGRGPINSHHAS